MHWMVTQLDSDIASYPTRSRRAARLSLARLQQSAGAGSGLESKRSTLGAYLSVDSYSQTAAAAAAAAAAGHIVKYYCKYQDRLTLSSALGTSLRRQAKGRRRWLGRLGPTRSAAHPASLFAAPDNNKQQQ